ncbi:BgTH12-00577 [Blumeria graminis f. sp. triticale]|uniref:37S ribosomal protein S25, mitochondrial n=3 Tax=Blumeria graminis TaxID=34373 RepID=A0A061HCC7_BLUGR|nr:Mitochondrial ribosomal [Blumeria graminis f. sp. tritici 96224]CAD6505078.1 BgTH12-00577 [Blumeria graminis f. sp. triticale]VDB93081.1 Bgt-3486 [Blumeria graminis f. sp. tritici]
MRGINLQPARVHQFTTRLLESKSISQEPPWYKIIGQFPPGEIMTRTQPVQHQSPKVHPRTRKPSKMFRPQKIEYEEDKLRQEFYRDHPWELARPRIVLENSGNESYEYDWSKIEQETKQLDGESVIQRQLWLMNNVDNMTRSMAYDIARKEFYNLRHTEEIERRLSKEEALYTGANFGPGPNEWGMGLENKTFESWKEWASRKIEEIELKREAGLYHELEEDTIGAQNPSEPLPDML